MRTNTIDIFHHPRDDGMEYESPYAMKKDAKKMRSDATAIGDDASRRSNAKSRV